MRRLAERPQNLSLAVKEFATPETLKKVGVFSAIGISVASLVGLTTKYLRK